MHVRADDAGAVVRYIGAHRGFEGKLQLDRDGFVRGYPELARRVLSGERSAAGTVSKTDL